MFKSLLKVSDQILRKYTPDPFVIAVGLSFLVLILATVLTPSTPTESIKYWGEGFWSLSVFTLQMAMILLGGFIVASAPPVKNGLRKIAGWARTPGQAIVLVTLVSAFAACLNWGFGLVVGAFFALETARIHTKVNFRVLVASAYSGFLFWHGGLSGSIPLVVNTPGNFSEEWLGGTVSIGQTLLSGFNITTLFALAVSISFLNWWMQKNHSGDDNIKPPEEKISQETTRKADSFAERLENAPWVSLFLFFLGAVYLILNLESFNLDLNNVNFIFLFLGVLLHKTPKSFLKATENAASKLGPVLVQYPLYAGIMGVMVHSGLAELFSEVFVSISSAKTFPLMSFLSAGLVNLFVPSGGGQWAVQAPIVIPAAKELGASLPLSIMAVAWGDAWTNMLQPFWALPLLAIAEIKVKEILGFCFLILLVSGVVISSLLLLFA